MSVQKETESGEVGDLLGGRGSQLLEVLSLWGFRGFFPATDYLTYLCSFSISIYLASYTFLFYFSCPSFFFFFLLRSMISPVLSLLPLFPSSYLVVCFPFPVYVIDIC